MLIEYLSKTIFSTIRIHTLFAKIKFMKSLYTTLLFILISFTTYSQVVFERVSDLMPQNYSISGDAFLEELSNGDLQLRLSDDFSTPQGPDVRILLGNSLSLSGAEELINLSDVGHFSGALTVDVPSNIDIDDFDFILFFCVQFQQFWASGEFGDVMSVGGPFCDPSDIFNDGGNNTVNICPSDGNSNEIDFGNSLGISAGPNYVYLITDDNEVLQEVVMDDSYDFEGSTSSTQRVYGMHYDGSLQAQVGSDRMATTASGCFEHSSNNSFITIEKDACCLISDVSNSTGPNIIDICPNDNIEDFIQFENSLNFDFTDGYAYLITDENEILEQVVFDDEFDFEGSGLNEQRVYGVHFMGNLMPAIGSPRTQTTASICAEHSNSNQFISVTKNACIQFTCETSIVYSSIPTMSTDSLFTLSICPSDGLADQVILRNTVDSIPTANYAYLITDNNQILQSVVLDSIFNFEGSGPNMQRVYGIHFDGTLNPAIGSNRLNTTATGCFTHSSPTRFLSITKDACTPIFECQASSVSSNGTTSFDICSSDGNADVIQLNNSLNAAAGSNYAYLITDQNNILERVVSANQYNFEGSSNQTQRVYGIHFDGTLNPIIGSDRLNTSATECFTHSSPTNFITITKNACTPIFECRSSSVSSNGTTLFDICSSDGNADVIQLSNSLNAAAGSNYAYLITDQNNILERVVSADQYNFEGSFDQTQRIYGIHFDGTLNPIIGSNRLNTSASECFTHSSSTNFITITKNACTPIFECRSSSVSGNGTTTIDICPSDGGADLIQFNNSINAAVGTNYVYLITDVNNILQRVVGVNQFNFEGSSAQTQRVYGIHFDGVLSPRIGSDRLMTTASECFQHSNAIGFLTVTKNNCTPAFECRTSNVSSSGTTQITICPTDGNNDFITFNNSINAPTGSNYAYLVTDTNNRLQSVVSGNQFNFEGTSVSEQRVFGIHFDGTLNAVIGSDRMQTTATGCFQHSNSFVSILKTGCTVPFECLESLTATTDWQTRVEICPTDGINDFIELRNNLFVPAGENYAYLITDAAGTLQSVTTDTLVNFEGSSLAEQRVYGIHFDGVLNPAIGQNRLNTTASGCFRHSGDNLFLTIAKTSCEPEFVCEESLTATTDWATEVDICATDGADDIIELRNNLFIPPGENYAYLITDASGTLQTVTTESFYNFEGSGTAEQRVYGVHFDGELNPVIGANRLNTTASGCFRHSGDNLFLTIRKNACTSTFECEESLTATTDWNTRVEVCPNDGVDDLIELRNNLFIEPGQNYAYLITDANDILMTVTTQGEYNFEGSGSAEQRVYGIHFDGTLNPALGQNRLETTATGCFRHSGANLFLTVAKSVCGEPYECVESLTATTFWVTEVDVCSTDNEDDIVILQNNINVPVGPNYVFLLTDEFENLQEVIFDTMYNFSNTGTDEQRVYGLSYSGQLDIRIGENRRNTDASECAIHSGDDLFIRINKTAACTTTSTLDTELANSINVHPIPSNGTINISYDNIDIDVNSVRLYDINGRFIREAERQSRINIDDAGIYFLRFQGDEANAVKKIIITK